MKKSLVIIGAVVVIIFFALAVIPFLFQGQIQKLANDAIAESVEATITYDDFGLSLFRDFPNLNVSVENLAVVGHDPFIGDTLIHANEFSVSLNLFTALFDDDLVITSIELDQPNVFVQVLENGSASYDIAVDSEEVADEESGYNLEISNWIIRDGSLEYDDLQSAFYIRIDDIAHQGRGDFSQDLFDMLTSTKARLVSVQYEGIEYLGDKQMDAEVTLEMDLPGSKYTFKENQVSINQFAFGFDGWVALPEESDDIQLDISFATHQNEFKYLLSLVPGMYTEGFENITTAGAIAMNGTASGVYNENQVPAFNVSLKVTDGMFQYPDLPTAVQNINLEMLVANENGNIDNTLIDISTMHLELGQNPVDGKIRIDGLLTPEIKADVSAGFSLGELTSMFPIEGSTLKGQYQLSLKAEGTYDSAAQTFPIVEAKMALADGYVKTDEFPESLEHFNFTSTISNPTGKLPDTHIEVPEFSFIMDKEKFEGELAVWNPNNFNWEVSLQGGVDLEKVSHVFSLDDMTLKGIIRGNLDSKGEMASLEAEQYEKIPTSGDFTIDDFAYASKDLAHTFKINSGRAAFTPQQITLTNIQAETGSTDMTVNGGVSNYINYLFKENAPIVGTMVMSSNVLNLNEWMTSTEDSLDSEPLSVLEIPTNVDFDIQSKANTVIYDNMVLKDLTGRVFIKNGIATMQQLNFNTLDGQFAMKGSYDPRDKKHPLFDVEVDMEGVAFKEAFKTFNTVKVFAPVAQFMSGEFNSSFKLNGGLKQDMMPDLSSLSMDGLVNVVTAVLSGADSKIVKGFTEITQFTQSPTEFNLNGTTIQVKIDDGKLHVEPFNANFGDYRTAVSGSTGIDGTMEFLVNMEVPAGVVGTSVNNAIASISGSDQPTSDKVNLNLNLSGSYDNPQFGLGGNQENTTAGLAKSAIDKKSAEAKDSAQSIIDEQAQELEESAQSHLDSLISNKVADSASSETLKNATKDLIDKEKVDEVLNIFKKKKKEEKEETEEEK